MTKKTPLSKESVFLNGLIPAAQAVELVLAAGSHVSSTLMLASSWRRTNGRVTAQRAIAQAFSALYDPLHVLAAATRAAGSDYPLDAAQAACEHFTQNLLGIFTKTRTRAAALSRFIAAWTANKGTEGTAAQKMFEGISRETFKKHLSDCLIDLERKVENLTGYSTSRHGLFLEQCQAICDNAPISKWRTFVRNGDWTLLESMCALVARDSHDKPINRSLMSNAGRAAMPTAWAAFFEATPDDSAQPAVTDGRLPTGVNVSTVPGGALRVSASFDPQALLPKDLRSEFRKSTTAVPPELREALKLKRFGVDCSVANLATEVANAQAWLHLAAQTSTNAVNDWLMPFLAKERQAALRKRLFEDYRPTEFADLHAVLTQILAEAPATIAKQKAR